MSASEPARGGEAGRTFPVSVKGVSVQAGKVLLLENERAEWELPGGKLELGEDPADCVVREIGEEAGWKVTAGPLLDCWQYHITRGRDVVIVTYGCHVISTEPPIVSHEHKRAGLFGPDEVPGLVMPEGYKRSVAAWFARLRLDGHAADAGMGELCGQCGASAAPSGRPARCPACQSPASAALPGAGPVAAAAWLPAAELAGPGGNLGAILRGYRRASALTQQQLADMLGYDRTYVSMIESGRRTPTDRGTLAHIARTLAIPPHLLGIAVPDGADFAAMLAFGTSVIRLAQIARQAGRAAEAVSELWSLITRLEARTAAGYAEPETISLLVQARMSLGVALGHLLPDEWLATAARWTGRALRIAWNLGDRPLLGLVLRMHGNELRKAGHPAAGVIRLRQALQIDDHPVRRGAGLVLLARAAAEAGQADLFDATTSQCVQAIGKASQQDVLVSPFTVREVRLRGLLATGRPAQAAELAGRYPTEGEPPSVHWRVIERITTADVLARSGDEHTAETMLTAALSDAETLRLPHQVQRIIRLASERYALDGQTVHQQARAALTRLGHQLADMAVQAGSDRGGIPAG